MSIISATKGNFFDMMLPPIRRRGNSLDLLARVEASIQINHLYDAEAFQAKFLSKRNLQRLKGRWQVANTRTTAVSFERPFHTS